MKIKVSIVYMRDVKDNGLVLQISISNPFALELADVFYFQIEKNILDQILITALFLFDLSDSYYA